MSCDPTPPKWCAWQRVPPGPWEVKITAATEDEARRLFRQRPFVGRFRDVAFLREGVSPNRPRRFL